MDADASQGVPFGNGLGQHDPGHDDLPHDRVGLSVNRGFRVEIDLVGIPLGEFTCAKCRGREEDHARQGDEATLVPA